MTTADAAGKEPSLWRNHDFRRFFAGQFVTNAGDSLYTVAVLWLVYQLSGSTVLTGIANAVLLLPWLLQILAGPIVDRLPLKPVLVGSQVLQGVVVLALPLAVATGRLSVGVLLAVVPVLTLATLLMAPMQATIVPRIVADTRLSRANSALATVTLGLDMVFDALGGAFIAVSAQRRCSCSTRSRSPSLACCSPVSPSRRPTPRTEHRRGPASRCSARTSPTCGPGSTCSVEPSSSNWCS